jgi:hypothetical protein
MPMSRLMVLTMLWLVGSCALPPDHKQPEEIPPVVQLLRSLPTAPKHSTPAPAPTLASSKSSIAATASASGSDVPLIYRRPVEPPLPLPEEKPGQAAPSVLAEETVRRAEPAEIPQEQADVLLEEAQYSYESRQLLADLWKQRRLPDATTQALVDRYLDLSLVELRLNKKSLQALPHWRELQIVPQTDFPFPATAMIEFAYDIAVDREAKLAEPEKYWNTPPPLNELNGYFLGSMGGSFPGRPIAMALCKIRLVDSGVHPPQPRWTLVKALHPITLEARE